MTIILYFGGCNVSDFWSKPQTGNVYKTVYNCPVITYCNYICNSPYRWGNNETLFSWARKSLRIVTAATKLKDACSLGEKL